MLAGLVLGASPALAAPGIAFDIDGRSIVLTADQLAAGADVAETTYVVDGTPQPLSGTSLRRALELAGANPDAISAVTASADLALLQLTRPDVAAVWPFPEGPALVWVDGEGRTALLRPASANGRAAQVIRSAPDTPLKATVDGAELIDVAIIASVETAKVGERVPLMARSGAENATYTWDFGDGTTAQGEKVTHRFTRAGRYRITVSASDAAGGGGTSQPVVVVVGAQKRRDADRGGASGRSRSSHDTGAASTPTPVAPPAVTSTASDPVVDAPAPAAAPAPAPQGKRKAKPKRAPQQEPEPVETPEPDPGEVSGTLLAEVSTPQSLAVRQAVASAPEPDSGGFHVAAIVWIALGSVLVLAFGVVAERRRRAKI